MRFFKGRESGFGAASLLGVVSLVAAGGIYLHNQESNRAASLVKKEKVRSQADLDLYSSLAIANSLFQPSETTQIPMIYPMTLIVNGNQDPMQTKIASQPSKTLLWKSSGSRLRDLKVGFSLPTVDKMDEQDWDNIANGKLIQTSNRIVLVTIDRVGVKKTENKKASYINSLDLKASLSDGSGSNFQKKALLYLPEPLLPACKTNYSGTSQGGTPQRFTGKVTISVGCSSVISDVVLSGLTATCRIEKQPWKDAGFMNYYAAKQRLVLQAICDKLGSYKPDEIQVAGTMGPSVPAGGNFLIVAPPPPPPPPPPACSGRKYGPYCYYLGGSSQSCNSVCSSRGGYDQAGTSWINNSGRCQAVLGLLGKSGSYKGTWSGNKAGCKYYGGFIGKGVWITNGVTGGDKGISKDQRACACKK